MVSVPYLFETTLLTIGYQFSKGVLPFPDLMLLVLTSLAGRLGGTLALYGLGRSGSTLLMKYKRRFELRTDTSKAIPFKLLSKINLLSPFSVAVGRLLWLRIPLTLVLGAMGKLKILLTAVVLSTVVYDGTYIIFGAIVGTTTVLEPIHAILYFLGGLTLIYGVTFAIRRWKNGRN